MTQHRTKRTKPKAPLDEANIWTHRHTHNNDITISTKGHSWQPGPPLSLLLSLSSLPFPSLSSPHFYVCIILIIQSNQSILLSWWLAVGAAILLSLCSVIALWQGMMASAEPFHLTLGVYRAEPSLRSPLSLCTRLAGPAWCPSYNFAAQTVRDEGREREGARRGKGVGSFVRRRAREI